MQLRNHPKPSPMRRSRPSNAMTRGAIIRIGYLLAMFLLAAQMPRVSLAEEGANQGGAAAAPGNDSPDHATGVGIPAPSNAPAGRATGAGDNGGTKAEEVSSKPQVVSPANGRETGGTPNGVHTGAAANDSSHSVQAHDAGPIDVHVAPPTRSNVNRVLAQDPKSRFKIVGSNPRPRWATGHVIAGRVVSRNSIGLVVPPQPGKLDRENKPAALVASPATSGQVPVKTEPAVEHTIAAYPNLPAPVPINGATIGGNANIRRGSNPGIIGGQAKTVAGINGSTIVRRTH
jgi:hypothetical protein